jgi:hypothetical protein
LGGLAALAVGLSAQSARAQDAVVVAPGNAPRVRAETYVYAGPNRALLASGLITFGIPYFSSAIVAASSSHPGDAHLWVPIAGPWLDLGNRGGCPLSSTSCDQETTNKILLVGNGILQAAGAIQLIGAFVFPEHTIAVIPATAVTPKMTLTPTTMARDGYGLAAVGEF